MRQNLRKYALIIFKTKYNLIKLNHIQFIYRQKRIGVDTLFATKSLGSVYLKQ